MVRHEVEDHIVMLAVAGEILSRVIKTHVCADGPDHFHIPRTANVANEEALAATRLSSTGWRFSVSQIRWVSPFGNLPLTNTPSGLSSLSSRPPTLTLKETAPPNVRHASACRNDSQNSSYRKCDSRVSDMLQLVAMIPKTQATVNATAACPTCFSLSPRSWTLKR